MQTQTRIQGAIECKVTQFRAIVGNQAYRQVKSLGFL